MKKARMFVSLLLAGVMMLTLAGCSGREMLDRLTALNKELSDSGSRQSVSQSDQDNTPDRIDIMLDALEKGDKEQFKSVFSKTTLTLADDIDEGLDYIFGIYEGEYVRTVYFNTSSDKHYGEKNTTLVNPIYVIQTTADKYYRISYSAWNVQEKDPDSLGIYSLIFTECDEDQRGGGGGPWLAGISYPGREGAETVAGNIAMTMITGDAKYLRSVLSDELLATEGIDLRTAEYAKEYSKINPSTVGNSWVRVREDGTFGYLVANTRPRTFIVNKITLSRRLY